MVLSITRAAKVYRLWIEADRQECFDDHADRGWICTLVTAKVGDNFSRDSVNGEVTTLIRLQRNGSSYPVLSATPDDVVVSDGVTVEVQSVSDFNAANPGNEVSR